MTKKNIRLLASGFFISGLLLTAFQTYNDSSAQSSGTEDLELLESNHRVLEEKAVQLELENEQLRKEYDKLVALQNDDSSTFQETEDFSESTEDEEADDSVESDSTDESDSDSDSATVEEYTIVISEGEPSSVIASQLVRYGLVDDFFEFNDYLEDNDLIRRVRPGEFTVSSDMNLTEIVEAIIH